MKDPYVLLNLTSDASEEASEATYTELKKKYSEERFLPGEQGNFAAEKLTELETAWSAIKLEQQKKKASGGGLGYIDEVIKKGDYNEAQKLLDSSPQRPAEWHYLQSIVFYKREWISESKAQLEMAVNLDPSNLKYRTALERMKMVTGNPAVDPATLGNFNPGAQTLGGDNASCSPCATCCLASACMDLCCGMSGCCGGE